MDTYILPVAPGDWFLLCSDGLTGQVEDLKLLEVTSRHREGADLEACARELIGLANAGGGDDNISVGILSVESID